MDKKKKILDYFSILKKRGLVASSYLFIGEDFSLVSDIIKLINCNQSLEPCGLCWDCRQLEQGSHPDLFVIEPENLTTKIEAVKEGMKFLSLKSFSLKAKPLIIKDAQSLTPVAASSFLKTLEEPPKNSFLALCTTKLDGVLATIISRCRKIFLPSAGQDPQGLGAQDVLGHLKAKAAVFKDRKEFRAFVWAFIGLLHAQLLVRAGCQNNSLPYRRECEIILKPFGIEQICSILKDILRIYGASDSVNMNLALNLIRAKIK